MNNSNVTIAVVADFKFLLKYFKNFYNQLRTKGNFHGTICVVTNLVIPNIIFKLFFNVKNVEVLSFKKIKFSKTTHNQLKNLNTLPNPNRHVTKNFQWHKLNLFDEKMKKWKFIFYIDINMNIHSDINGLLNLGKKNKLLARADGFPDYTWTLKGQFSQENHKYDQLRKKYNLDINNYFQSGILFFDTNLINKETKKELIKLVEEYPITLTNEQAILNLFFIFDNNFYEELPIYIDGYLTYYYWKPKNKKVIITKQLKEKDK